MGKVTQSEGGGSGGGGGVGEKEGEWEQDLEREGLLEGMLRLDYMRSGQVFTGPAAALRSFVSQ
jgi:hypothetical protein